MGAIAALQMAPGMVDGMRQEFDSRRKFAIELLRQVPRLGVVEPQGAFYFYLDVSQFLGGAVKDDVALSELLLEKAHVALVPGSVFEGPGCLRMSYAASKKDIQRGIERMKEVLASL